MTYTHSKIPHFISFINLITSLAFLGWDPSPESTDVRIHCTLFWLAACFWNSLGVCNSFLV